MTARQVAIAMLQAAEEGKTVQQRSVNDDKWTTVPPDALGPQWCFDTLRYEWRIKPTTEPVKAMREFWVCPNPMEDGRDCVWESACKTHVAHDHKTPSGYIHVREVSESHDAEIAELRRNHDALVAAIHRAKRHVSEHGFNALLDCMQLEGAVL